MGKGLERNILSQVSWPAILLVIFITTVVVFSWKYLRVATLQPAFWMFAIIGLGGDSFTTGLLGKCGLEEQQMGWTRKVCGAHPSMICSFITRLGIFVFFFGLYYAIRSFELWNFHPYFFAIIYLPVALAAAGIGATTINGVSILLGKIRGDCSGFLSDFQ